MQSRRVRTTNPEPLGRESTPDALAAAALRDGVVLLRGWVEPTTVNAVAAAVEAAMVAAGLGPLVRPADEDGSAFDLRERGWDDPRWIELQAYVLSSPTIQELRDDPGLNRALRALCGGEIHSAQGDITRIAPPMQPHLTTRPHQDGFYIPDSESLWTSWLPLVPCPLALGPLAVIPGSYHQGLQAHRITDLGVPELAALPRPKLLSARAVQDPWWSTDLEPGDALIFHSRTIHAALPNLSTTQVRASVDLRFRFSEP